MIEGALIALGGTVLGFLLGRFRRGPKAAPKPARPICGCKHHVSYHDGSRGCHAQVRLKGIDGWLGDTEVCECRKYTGPEPLPEYYAPEIPA